MSPEAQPSSCPLCGAPLDSLADACGACGSRLAPRDRSGCWTQPVFESAVARGRSAARGGLVRLVLAVGRAGETAAAIALRPQDAFHSFRFEGPVGPALAYAALLLSPSFLLCVALRTVLLEPELRRAALALLRAPLAVAGILAAPVAYIVLRAHLLHLALVVAGRARRSFAGTLRPVAYACGSVAPLLLLPYAGDFLFVAASVLVEGLGLRAAHELTLRQAAGLELLLSLPFVVGVAMAAPLAFLWFLETLR